MAFKTILSIVGLGQGNRDLELGIEICRNAEAHLAVMVVSPAASIPVGAYADVVSDVWYAERQQEAKRLAVRVREVSELLKTESLSADVASGHTEYGLIGEIVGRRARYADLALLGPSLWADDGLKDQVLDGAMFRAGRPVLVVPETTKATLSPERISIAWDGGLEAARAVGYSIGMLVEAKAVHIVMVDPVSGEQGHGAEPGADLAAYLARHGINAIVDRVASSGKPVCDVLTGHATDNDCGLIVMGAYGHSRLRERIFGGVTQSMLTRVTIPLLMAH